MDSRVKLYFLYTPPYPIISATLPFQHWAFSDFFFIFTHFIVQWKRYKQSLHPRLIEMENDKITLENLGHFLEILNMYQLKPATPLLLTQTKNICPQNLLFKNLCFSFIHNSPKLQQPNILQQKKINKLWYFYIMKTLLSNIKSELLMCRIA